MSILLDETDLALFLLQDDQLNMMKNSTKQKRELFDSHVVQCGEFDQKDAKVYAKFVKKEAHLPSDHSSLELSGGSEMCANCLPLNADQVSWP